MTALGVDLATRFQHAFALLGDLEKLAPDEHASIVHNLIDQLRVITADRRARQRIAAAATKGA